MSRPRTIRQMQYVEGLTDATNPRWVKMWDVLVIPDNPAAREAMVDRVYKANRGGNKVCPALSPAAIDYILHTALSLPSRRKHR